MLLKPSLNIHTGSSLSTEELGWQHWRRAPCYRCVPGENYKNQTDNIKVQIKFQPACDMLSSAQIKQPAENQAPVPTYHLFHSQHWSPNVKDRFKSQCKCRNMKQSDTSWGKLVWSYPESPSVPLLSPQRSKLLLLWDRAPTSPHVSQHLILLQPSRSSPQRQDSAFWNQFLALSPHKGSEITGSVSPCSALRTWLLLRNTSAKSGASSPDFLHLKKTKKPRTFQG